MFHIFFNAVFLVDHTSCLSPVILPEFAVRFDALLMHPRDVASRIRAAAMATLNPSVPLETNPYKGWGEWRASDDQAIAATVAEALAGEAESVYDEMEVELANAAARGN